MVPGGNPRALCMMPDVRQDGAFMSESTNSVIDLAAQHGMRKQTVFMVLARPGIETVKRPGNNKTNRVRGFPAALQRER